MSSKSTRKAKNVPKPLGARIIELIQALQVINDSLRLSSTGEAHQVIPLYGQLRALIADTTTTPLLKEIASRLGEDLTLYAMPDIEHDGFPPGLMEGMVFRIEGFPVGVTQELPGQQRITLDQLLNHKVLWYNGQVYDVKQIIQFYANKAGGAHYDPDLPSFMAELSSFEFFGQPGLINFLRQIGQVVFELGLRVLRHLSDIEIHLPLAIPAQQLPAPAYILDIRYPDSPMRVFLRVEPLGIGPSMVFRFGVTSIQRYQAEITNRRLSDWSTPHHVVVASRINDDMSTSLSLIVDGEPVAQDKVGVPLFIGIQPAHWKTYVNRSHESADEGLTFGLRALTIFNPSDSLYDEAERMLTFAEIVQNPENTYATFKKGVYLVSEPGTSDFETVGITPQMKASEILINTA